MNKVAASGFILSLIACGDCAPKVVEGGSEGATWRNLYPNGCDTTTVQHTAFFESGVKWHEVLLVHGVRDGVFQEWDEYGELVTTGYYTVGKRTGIWVTEPNGLTRVKTYVADTLSGPYFEKLEDGRIVFGQYSEGMENGDWIWMMNGMIDQSAQYFKGKLNGASISYWPSGATRAKAEYVQGQLLRVEYYDSLGVRTDEHGAGVRAE
jgi:antitoxin component YwqK of YwqJK toxin-antitoxin module